MSTQEKMNKTGEIPISEEVTEKVREDIAQREGVEIPRGEELIRVKDLKMYFPVTRGLLKRRVADVKAVDGVSFSLNSGETIGIVGESGSGKSTLGNCVMRNIKPTAGSITFAGQEVSQLKEKQLRQYHRKIQMITQNPYASLDPRMNIEDVITEGLRINHMGTKQEQKETAERMMVLVGLNPKLMSRYPHEFSGGQRQRISIARALAMNPAAIVCDEIVSALDVSIQAQIVALMMNLQEQLGLTYIFIGHDLSVVRHLSTNVAVMYLGKFMELTNSEELYSHPLHPYTQALISAAPIPDPKVDKERTRIVLSGEVPSPINPPEGCRFCTRCMYATERCKQEEPEFAEVSAGHYVACHRVKGGN